MHTVIPKKKRISARNAQADFSNITLFFPLSVVWNVHRCSIGYFDNDKFELSSIRLYIFQFENTKKELVISNVQK